MEMGEGAGRLAELAAEAAEELRRLHPNQSRVVKCGPLSLPVLVQQRGGAEVAYVMVHPFWRMDESALAAGPLADTVAAAPGREVYFVDTFDVARRPVKALDLARTRNPRSFRRKLANTRGGCEGEENGRATFSIRRVEHS